MGEEFHAAAGERFQDGFGMSPGEWFQDGEPRTDGFETTRPQEDGSGDRKRAAETGIQGRSEK